MNKLLLTLCCLFGYTSFLSAQANIAEARGMMVGATVTITGIVTNGEELGIIRYIQDATGGLPAYPGTGSSPNFPDNVKRGDSIVVTGDSILTTFDRLEVAEFSARSLTQARLLGTLQPIGNEEIDELKEKFNL